MNSSMQTRFALVLAVAAVFAGYWLGASHPVAQAADDAPAKTETPAASNTVMIGVSIPNGGAAVIKGKDGYAYIVDSRGVYTRAAQSGKPLELP